MKESFRFVTMVFDRGATEVPPFKGVSRSCGRKQKVRADGSVLRENPEIEQRILSALGK
jgi:hypothetical protein